MMGGGEFKSSLVQQMVVWGGTSKRNIKSGLMPCAEEQEESTKMPPLASPSLLFPHDHHQLLHLSSGQVPEVGSTATSPANLHGGQEDHMPESWRQMLLGGLIGDHERYSSTATALLSKGLEGPVPQAGAAYNFCEHGGGDEISKSQSQLSQMLLASSPRSCISTSLGGGMLDFSNSGAAPAPEVRNHHSDNSCESNSTTTGSALKKARVQASSSAQSTLKVRKERLGDRITALHQIVSPFGKTDTASVLQETVGYIRFLLGQIEALSYPYMENGSSMRQRTLLNHSNHNNATTELAHQAEKDSEDGEEGKKDLRSRGLCLMPVSCTSHLGADNASDFWAPLPPPPPLPGIILR